MKKIILLMICCLLVTGCTVVRIDTTSISNITDVILEKDNSLYNHVGKGYKYYIPRGVSYIDTIGLNDVLYSKGVYYYLYVDAPAYLNKSDITYEEDKNLYYSKKIDINDKKGYLEIKKQDEQYLIKFSYNYASFETLVDEKDIEEVIKFSGLGEGINRRVKTYSLGMRMRLGLSIAFLGKPKLIILDEPTNGLDPAGIRQLRNILRNIAKQNDVCIIVSSHLMSEMELMCDKVAIVNNKTIPMKPNKGPKLENISRIFAFLAKSSCVIFFSVFNAI